MKTLIVESYTPGITGLQFKNYNFTGSLFKYWVVCTISRTVPTDEFITVS